MRYRSFNISTGLWGGLLLFGLGLSSASVHAGCKGELAVQVLGSGGSIVNTERASASYLLSTRLWRRTQQSFAGY